MGRMITVLVLIILINLTNSFAEWKLTSAPSAATIRRFELKECKSLLYAFGDKKVIYKTNDVQNFENWTEIRYNFNEYIREININSKEQIFILSTDSVFVSNDLGKTFKSLMKNPVKSAWNFIFTVDDSLLLNTDVGLQKYDYTAKKWVFFGPGATPNDDNFVYDIIQKDSLIIAVNKTSIFESIDKGKNWKLVKQIYSSAAGNLTSVAKLPNGNYLTCFLNAGTYLIDTTGLIINTYKDMKTITDFVVDDYGNAYALNSNYKYQTQESVYRLDFGDTNFVLYDKNLYFGDAVQGINIKNKGILIGVRNDGLYILKNNTDKWEKTGFSMNEAFINFMGAAKNGTLWVSVYPDYLYKSTNEGKKWIPVRTFPRERFDIYDIERMGENSEGHIYFQCENKVFFTTDEGDTWEEINYPNSIKYVSSFFITPDNNIILADNYKVYEWDGDIYTEVMNWEKAIPVAIDNFLDKLIFIGNNQYRHIYFDNNPGTFGPGSINTGFIQDKNNNFIIGDLENGLSYVKRGDYISRKYEHPNNSGCKVLFSNGGINASILKSGESQASIVLVDSSDIKDISANIQNTNLQGLAKSGNKMIASSDMDMYEMDIDVISPVNENSEENNIKIIGKTLYITGIDYTGFEIYDIKGAPKLISNNNTSETINLEKFDAGAYFIKLISNGKTINKKFILL